MKLQLPVQILVILLTVTAALILASLIASALGNEAAGTVLMTIVVVGWAALVVGGAVCVGALYSRLLMREGATIALKAQEVDNKDDTALTHDLARVFSLGAQAGRQTQTPVLPVYPSDLTDMLPPLSLPQWASKQDEDE